MTMSLREKMMQDWQTKLSGTKWELEVVVSGRGQPKVVQSDVLTFERGALVSDTLAKAGFDRAEYSLYPPTEQSIEWEAMQHKEEKGTQETAIWRGEFTGDAIQGNLTKRRKKGDKETVEHFSFTGHRVVAPAPAPPPEATPPVPQGQTSAPVSEGGLR